MKKTTVLAAATVTVALGAVVVSNMPTPSRDTTPTPTQITEAKPLATPTAPEGCQPLSDQESRELTGLLHPEENGTLEAASSITVDGTRFAALLVRSQAGTINYPAIIFATDGTTWFAANPAAARASTAPNRVADFVATTGEDKASACMSFAATGNR